MRLKYYLRGAGIGIIVTTIILMVAFAFSKDHSAISDEAAIKRAKELGYVLEEKSEPVTEEDTKEDSSINNDSNSKDSSKSEEASDEKLAGDLDNSNPLVGNEEENQVVNYVPFTISAGESSNTVALHLQQAGLVEDADEFNDYMNQLGVDNLIQGGTFYVADNSTKEDLIAILVTKQDKRMTSPPKND